MPQPYNANRFTEVMESNALTLVTEASDLEFSVIQSRWPDEVAVRYENFTWYFRRSAHSPERYLRTNSTCPISYLTIFND